MLFFALIQAVVDQNKGQFVDLEVLDQDPGDDDELGSASVDIEGVANNGSMDSVRITIFYPKKRRYSFYTHTVLFCFIGVDRKLIWLQVYIKVCLVHLFISMI